jgi:hypothetical protein
MNNIYAPGPWTVTGPSIKAIDHGTRFTIAKVAGGKLSPEGIVGTARLMAASPELLNALYLALPYVEDCADDPCYKPGVVNKAIQTIKAALAKAGENA